MAERKKIALIDGSSYIYRAFYAVRGLANSKGFPTGAAYGFIGMLRRVVGDIRPDYLLVAYDAKGPTFRHELFADYKAHRPEMPDDLKPQIPRIKEIVSAYNIESLEMPGYEADDIIAQIVRELPADVEAVIVTGDKDLGQLVSDRVTLLDTMKDRVTDQAAIREKYGTDPAGLAEIFGLAGDSSDNIPGVPGIGEKGAVDLIKKYGTIDELLRHKDDLTGKKRELLERHGELALLSRRLFILDHQVPLAFTLAAAEIKPPDAERLKSIFADLEFHTYLKELERPGTGIAVPHETITDDAALSSVISRAQKAAMLAVDLETTSLSPVDAEIVGISLCFSDDAAYYIPLAHRYLGAPKQLDRTKTLSALGPLLTSPGVPKAGQNIKYDYLVMKNYGINISPVAFDTMVASYVINPSRRTHNLETISLEYLGHRPISYKDVAGKGKGQITFDQVPVEEASRYSAEDAYLTYLLIPILKTKMDELSLGRLFDDIEMPLVIVLADMEMTGVKVDEGALGALSREFTEKLVVLEHTIIEEAGQQFNINSTQQLARILFDKLGLGGFKKTKTGFSTDNDVLTALADAHPIIPHILEYRTLAKLKSTYVDALPRLINGKTGRIHTSYNQTVAATGRLSSSDPNLQNIPIRTPEGRRIRAAFVPRQGCVLVSADYSQIELRLLAHFCKDPALTRTFFDDEDIHASTAALIFSVDPADVTADMRRRAKTINFGIIYGISPHGLARELGIPYGDAKVFIETYFAKFAGVKDYFETVMKKAEADGFVTTIMDRRRYLPELKSSDRNVKAFAQRMAVNTPIQGSAADLIKMAMISLFRRLGAEGLEAKMIMQVHDELVLEVPTEEEARVCAIVKEEMEGVMKLNVPLKVDINSGKNWADAH
ncbi:MAG: DNA polymerase I [Deltaproteobacteria bacterium]|nr:DNA polymerase I [Candidatus Zymogenaceae bacterium]